MTASSSWCWPVGAFRREFCPGFSGQWFTGPVQPLTNHIADATPLGHLPGEIIRFATESWGLPLGKTLTVSTNADPTAGGVRAQWGRVSDECGGSFQRHLRGRGKHESPWIGCLFHNRGAPSLSAIPAGGDYEQRFYPAFDSALNNGERLWLLFSQTRILNDEVGALKFFSFFGLRPFPWPVVAGFRSHGPITPVMASTPLP